MCFSADPILKRYEFIATGPAIGLIFGLIIGQKVEKSYTEKGLIRCLHDEEKVKRRKYLILGLLLLLIGLFALVFFK